MNVMRFVRTHFVRFAAVMAIVGIAMPAEAFDTSGHFEATRIALRQLGFSESAIDAVLIANFQTDYVVNQKSFQRTDHFDEDLAHLAAYRFHFDDLGTRKLVEREFAWLETGSREMAARFAAERNPEKLLNLLGIVLHAVQDFYSHASFVDRDWARFTGRRIMTADDLGSDLWRADLPSVFVATDRRGIFTGNAEPALHPAPPNAADWPKHGSSTTICGASQPAAVCGQNHDSVLRRNHLTALLAAARATKQLTENFRIWIADDALWETMKGYRGSHVTSCLRRAEQMAEAVGHGPMPVAKSATEVGAGAANAALQTSCSDAWEVRWSHNLVEFYEFVRPATHQVTDLARARSTGVPATKEWPSGDIFRVEPDTRFPPREFVGTYSLVWGQRPGVLVLEEDAAESISGRLTIAGVTRRVYGNVEGHRLSFGARDGLGALSGELHLFTQNRNAMAGSIQDETGRPDGAYATKVTLLAAPIVTNAVVP